MRHGPARFGLTVTALAALAGCAADRGFEAPDLPASVTGHSVPYAPYGPGYFFGPGAAFAYGYPFGYDPRFAGYGYDPFYAGFGFAGPYGYGPYYYPYPIYVGVPCTDANNDGRCDHRHRHHDDPPPSAGGTFVPPHPPDDGQPDRPRHVRERQEATPKPRPQPLPAPKIVPAPLPGPSMIPSLPDPTMPEPRRDPARNRANQP